MENTETLSRLIAKFCIKFDIEEIADTTVYGWNHTRPGIGFFNNRGEEIANICDKSLYDLDDFTNAYNEYGEPIDDDDDDDFKNSKEVYELHIPEFHASPEVKHGCGVSFRRRPDETIVEEEHAEYINDELRGLDVYFDVFYKKNHRRVKDAYEFFFKKCERYFSPVIDKALKYVDEYKRLDDFVDTRKYWHYACDAYTWKEFKEMHDLPKTLTKAEFEARADAAKKRMEDLLTVTDDCQ